MASNPALRIYDSPGQVLACCFDPAKALCRRDTRASERHRTPGPEHLRQPVREHRPHRHPHRGSAR
jgi:hypothetical protein